MELRTRLRGAYEMVFPGGPTDIERDGRIIFVALRGRIPLAECENFVAWAKPLAASTYDPTGDLMHQAYGNWLAGYFTSFWCALFAFIAAFKIGEMLTPESPVAIVGGGDGASEATAVEIRAAGSQLAIAAMYHYLDRLLSPGPEWRIARRLTLWRGSIPTEELHIAFDDGSLRTFFIVLAPTKASDAALMVAR